MNEKKINYRTRFAPSPTGELHIGSARTALFNYIIAEKFSGDFILRIDDTDILRNIDNSVYSLYEDLKWLKIFPQESIFGNLKEDSYYGPYRQMERLNIYKKYSSLLLKKKLSYFCFCTKEEIDDEKKIFLSSNKRSNYQYSRKCLNLNDNEINKNLIEEKKFVIRLMIDRSKEYSFTDLIRKKISFLGNDIEDFVIIKENGIPTYNFSCVIDDYLMKISHVLRGEEHISNTGKQLVIYDYLNWEPPIFAHLSLIINEDSGKKISKRDDNRDFQLIKKLREIGYLPEAIINYLFFLGWYPKKINFSKKENKEFFDFKEMISIFDFESFNSSPTSYSIRKLDWYNRNYIKNLDDELFHKISFDFFKKEYDSSDFLDKFDEQYCHFISDIFRKKINNFRELIDLSRYFFSFSFSDLLINDDYLLILREFVFFISDFEVWNEIEIKKKLEEFLFIRKLDKKNFYHFLRKLLTNQESGPELFKIIFILGKKEIIKRLESYYYTS